VVFSTLRITWIIDECTHDCIVITVMDSAGFC
jgi:hypothetical protein